MPKRISDMRDGIQTLDAARQVFDQLAMTIIKLAAADAILEKKIAKLKFDHDAATALDRDIVAAAGKLLARFIEQHKDQFQDPRKIKTNFGCFGLQSVTELLVDDPDRLEKYLIAHDFKDCFEPVIKVIKKAVLKRIKAGKKLPGARINNGDTATYKVEKSLIDIAKKQAIA